MATSTGCRPAAASHVYRIVQEGLTNIGKHANASRARVTLEHSSGHRRKPASRQRWLALTIEDDGCGVVDDRCRQQRATGWG